MDQVVFQRFTQLIYEKSGITLRPGKEALVSARVGKRMRALGLWSHEEYLDRVTGDETGEEIVHLLDAISTNLTSFFREPDHFDHLTNAFRQWIDAGQSRVRIWSAASSTGEEPYSIAMTLQESMAASLDVRILATDICTRVLEACERGCYSEERTKTVPPAMRNRYFHRHGGRKESIFEVKPCLKEMIVFRRLNLSKPPFPMKGPLDVVFCRNVMIYFDNEVRGRLLAEIHRLLKPGGLLFVGHSESLIGLKTDFTQVAASVYTK